MKRDMDIVRNLLLLVESKPANRYFRFPDSEHAGADRMEEMLAEMGRLIDAGLIRGNGTKNAMGSYSWFTVWDLTQEGADLLETIRNETVWEQTKDKVRSVGGGMAIETIKAVATYYLNKLLGLGG